MPPLLILPTLSYNFAVLLRVIPSLAVHTLHRSQMAQENEATARAINAQPWEPLPGMLKPGFVPQGVNCAFCEGNSRTPIAFGSALVPRCVRSQTMNT